MELTPDTLDAMLQILKENGVREFEGLGFHVKFAKDRELPMHEPQVEHYPDERPREQPGVGARQWDNPLLWPGGKPPAFPKKAK